MTTTLDHILVRYDALQSNHSPRETLPVTACRDECPLCDGPINRMHKTRPRYDEVRRRWKLTAVIRCEHCAAASFAEFVCSPDGKTTTLKLGGGLIRSPERQQWFVDQYPELMEVFEPA